MKFAMLAAAAAVALAPVATAEGLYGDLNYSFISSDEDGVDVNLGAIVAHAGYAFTPNFAVEGELGFGVNDDEFDVLGADVSVGLNYVAGIYGVGILPVSEQINLFARAGLVQAELEAEASFGGAAASESDSEGGYAIGLGGSYNFNEKAYLRADYTRYDIDESEVDAFMIGIGFKH